jgi:hypothetical protein
MKLYYTYSFQTLPVKTDLLHKKIWSGGLLYLTSVIHGYYKIKNYEGAKYLVARRD